MLRCFIQRMNGHLWNRGMGILPMPFKLESNEQKVAR